MYRSLSLVDHYSHLFSSWTWPWGQQRPHGLISKRHFTAPSTVINFSQWLLHRFIGLLITTPWLCTAVCGVSSTEVTETLSVSPGQRPLFLSLTHTAHHSLLIRGGGGGRVEFTLLLLLARLHWDNMLSLFSRSDVCWLIRSSAEPGSALRSADTDTQRPQRCYKGVKVSAALQHKFFVEMFYLNPSETVYLSLLHSFTLYHFTWSTLNTKAPVLCD